MKEINNINPKEKPGFDVITAEIFKLSKKTFVNLTYLINELKYFSTLSKVVELIMILKPTKHQPVTCSYRQKSLLSVMSKLIERLHFNRLQSVIEGRNLISTHQVGFTRNILDTLPTLQKKC